MTRPAGLHRIGLSVAVCAALVVLVAPAGQHRSASRTSQDAWAGLPWPAKALISRALGGADRAFRMITSRGGFTAVNARQQLVTRFSRTGVLVRSGAARLGLSLDGYGYQGRLGTLAAVAAGSAGSGGWPRRLSTSSTRPGPDPADRQATDLSPD